MVWLLHWFIEKVNWLHSISRGNGVEGSDWSKKSDFLPAITKKIPNHAYQLILQGELFWYHSGHQQVIMGGANARNKVAGWLM